MTRWVSFSSFGLVSFVITMFFLSVSAYLVLLGAQIVQDVVAVAVKLSSTIILLFKRDRREEMCAARA